jgi:hypothetical protein
MKLKKALSYQFSYISKSQTDARDKQIFNIKIEGKLINALRVPIMLYYYERTERNPNWFEKKKVNISSLKRISRNSLRMK